MALQASTISRVSELLTLLEEDDGASRALAEAVYRLRSGALRVSLLSIIPRGKAGVGHGRVDGDATAALAAIRDDLSANGE